jgi:hypothetical protein
LYRPWRGRPAGRRAQSGHGGSGGSDGGHQIRDDRPDYDRPGSEPVGEFLYDLDRIGRTPEYYHQPVALHRAERIEAGIAGGVPDRVSHVGAACLGLRRSADHDSHV